MCDGGGQNQSYRRGIVFGHDLGKVLLPIIADDENSIARLASIDQISVENDVDGARQLAGWRLLRQLLRSDGLRVLVSAQAILGHENIPFVILYSNIECIKRVSGYYYGNIFTRVGYAVEEGSAL